MNNIQHVFFDLDHTLWDFEKNSDLTFKKVFNEQNITVNLDRFFEIYKPVNKNYWKLYQEEKVTKSELRYGRLKDTFDALSYDISDKLIDILAVKYIDFLPDFNYLFEGAFEILDYLKGKYKLHIITNGFEEVQIKKMESSNILHYFDQIITSESVGVKKPNSKIFHYALKLAKANENNSIMIGDNLEADVLGAINIGMEAIYFNLEKANTDDENIIRISSLLELKEYI